MLEATPTHFDRCAVWLIPLIFQQNALKAFCEKYAVEGGKDGITINDLSHSCLLSGVFYNIMEGFVRGDRASKLFIVFLEKYGYLTWQKDENTKKETMRVNIMEGSLVGSSRPGIWDEWQRLYFGKGETEGLKELERMLWEGNRKKRYERMTRHANKYSIVRRPGEDSFAF